MSSGQYMLLHPLLALFKVEYAVGYDWPSNEVKLRRRISWLEKYAVGSIQFPHWARRFSANAV